MTTKAIILAAGAGTRMKSKRPKVVHEILGKPMIDWAIDAALQADIDEVVCVLGHKREQVEQIIDGKCSIAIQEEQLGTGHAVICALEHDRMKDAAGSVVIYCGDTPLLRSSTLCKLIEHQKKSGSAGVVLSMEPNDPFGYGRIVRDADGSFLRIVEQKDATEDEAAILECNSGIYCFDMPILRESLEEIEANNAQGELYLTDVLEIMRNKGYSVSAVKCDDPTECFGVNSRKQLAEVSKIAQMRINDDLMESGVSMIDPDLVWISPNVSVGSDTVMYPMVSLSGDTVIGNDCVIGPNSRLADCEVGDGCTIDETIAIEAKIDDNVSTGPRCYLRPGAHLMDGSKAGCSVEIKNSTVGVGSKVPHLSYIGDTTIGKNVNVGAGSITCNYDGKKKHKTVIGDNAFIGSDTMMVAPVNIGDDVVVGAGSVITYDVPDKALAIGRAREKVIEGWAEKHK